MATKKTPDPTKKKVTKKTAKKETKVKPKKEVTSLAVEEPTVKETSNDVIEKSNEEVPKEEVQGIAQEEKDQIPVIAVEEKTEVKEISLEGTTPDPAPEATPTLATPVEEKDKTSTEQSIETAHKDAAAAATAVAADVVHLEREPEKRFNKKLLIPLIIVLVALIALVVYQFVIKKTDFLSPLSTGESDQSVSGDGSAKSTEFQNPINGMYYSNEEAEKFKDLKPVAVMVNNYEVARPSAGLSKADIIYEVVAEGGITRLMPIFYSQQPEIVSSIRSARYYFVELASPYSSHYIHWGAAHVPPCQKAPISSPDYCPPVNGKLETEPDVDAYTRIVQLGLPNLDGGNYSCDGDGCAFGRDPNKVGKVPMEHTAFIRFDEMLNLAKDIRPQDSWHEYIEVTEWAFKDDASIEERGDIGLTTPITYNYWDLPGFAVKWEYDKENNEYMRYQGGVKQVDAIDDSELRAKTIVIRYTNQTPVGDQKSHLYHDIVGTGDALIFQDGQAIEATWTRTTHDVRDIYTDANGDQIKFVRGQIWVQLVPTGSEVSYQAAAVVAEPAQKE